MHALILTAGLGTRLRPLTYVRAKAAVPVNGEAIVRRVLAWLAGEGVRDVVLNLHHHPESIAAVVGDGRDVSLRVRYSWENPVLGSGGGPRRAVPLIEAEERQGSAFLIVNGDTLTELPLAPLVERHDRSGALVTMALTVNPNPDVYGGVTVDGGRVTGFSRPGTAAESFHFVGVQIADFRAFDSLAEGVPAESVMQLYPRLISEVPGAVAAHLVDAPFRDIGKPADYLQTSLDLARIEGDRLISGRGIAIDSTAELVRTAVWDDVAIGAAARLEDCIVCDGTRIPAGARYQRCAIVPAREPARAGEWIEGGLLLKRF